MSKRNVFCERPEKSVLYRFILASFASIIALFRHIFGQYYNSRAFWVTHSPKQQHKIICSMHRGTWKGPKLQNFTIILAVFGVGLTKKFFAWIIQFFSLKWLKIGVFALFGTYIYTYILLGSFGRGHPIPPTSTSTYPFINLPTYLSIDLSIYQPIDLSTYQSTDI